MSTASSVLLTLLLSFAQAESGEGSEDAEGQEMTPTHGHGTQSRPSRHGGQVFRRRTQSDGAPLRVQFADDTEDPGESRCVPGGRFPCFCATSATTDDS